MRINAITVCATDFEIISRSVPASIEGKLAFHKVHPGSRIHGNRGRAQPRRAPGSTAPIEIRAGCGFGARCPRAVASWVLQQRGAAATAQHHDAEFAAGFAYSCQNARPKLPFDRLDHAAFAKRLRAALADDAFLLGLAECIPRAWTVLGDEYDRLHKLLVKGRCWSAVPAL